MTRQWVRWIWRLATLVAAVVVAGSGAVAAGPNLPWAIFGSRATVYQPLCPVGRTVPIQDSRHISQAAAAAVRYTTLPPTSGPHFAFVAAPGIYREPVPEGLAVHAMEHGHVVIWYSPDIAASDVAVLTDVARRHPADVILTPYRRLAAGVAVTSWGCLGSLPSVDGPQVEAFVRVLRDRYDHGWTRWAIGQPVR